VECRELRFNLAVASTVEHVHGPRIGIKQVKLKEELWAVAD
jgi:hypothetical protein